ncbi:unnamed protein product, partial [Musa textilis]
EGVSSEHSNHFYRLKKLQHGRSEVLGREPDLSVGGVGRSTLRPVFVQVLFPAISAHETARNPAGARDIDEPKPYRDDPGPPDSPSHAPGPW